MSTTISTSFMLASMLYSHCCIIYICFSIKDLVWLYLFSLSSSLYSPWPVSLILVLYLADSLSRKVPLCKPGPAQGLAFHPMRDRKLGLKQKCEASEFSVSENVTSLNHSAFSKKCKKIIIYISFLSFTRPTLSWKVPPCKPGPAQGFFLLKGSFSLPLCLSGG